MIVSLNQLGNAWAAYFGLAVVQNTVFLAVVLLVLYLSRRLSAGARYIIAAVGVLKLVLPPFLPAGRLIPGVASSGEVSGILTTLGSIGMNTASTPAEVLQVPAPSLIALLFVSWLLGALVFLVTAFTSAVRLMRRLRGSTAVAIDGLVPRPTGCEVSVHRCPRIGSPLTLGLLGRRIFVPSSWDTWSAECRRAVIRHEAAHIERNDSLLQSLQLIAQAIYLFHPLVWMLNKRMNDLREMACDDASAGQTERARLMYSRCLVNIAESLARTPGVSRSATALIEGKAGLAGRVRYQMEARSMRPLSHKGRASLLIAAALLLIIFSWHTGGSGAGPASAAKAGNDMQSVVLSIESNDLMSIDGRKTSFETLQADLKTAIDGREDRVVVAFAVRDEVPVKTLLECERHLRAVGLDKVAYETSGGARLALVLPPETYDEATLKRLQGNVATIHLTSDGSVVVNGRAVDLKEMSDQTRKLVMSNENVVISIKTEEEATYGGLVDVLRRLKEGGATRITINDPNV